MRPFLSASAVFALLFSRSANAFWRMGCSIIQSGRVDPLVNPGAIAAHAHTIVGGSNIGVNSTFDTLSQSECTSCEIAADKSAYWTPLFYYQYPNGSFFEVPHGGSVAYYLGRGPNSDNIIPFPPGMMILSGNKAARSYDNKTSTWGNSTYPGRPIADRVSFVCLSAGISPPEIPYMFANVSQCINGMRAQIAFQACWNGIDLYKADNSHVAYMSQIVDGICPPQYPYQLPNLFLETDYSPSQVPDVTDDGVWTFSQGDTTGYGFHGDFLNGWDMDVQTQAVAECLSTDNAGQISACPVLQASQSNGYPWNCPEAAPQIGEPVHGLLDKLPGCVELTYGPQAATSAQMDCPANVRLPAIATTADSTPRPTAQPTAAGQAFGLPNQEYLGCFNDSAAGIRVLNAASYTNYTAMTVEFCQAYCMKLGYRLSGVEYTQECHCDTYINPTAVSGNTECTWNCGGTMTHGGTQEICGGLQVINVYNNTDPDFVANGSLINTAGNAIPYTPAAGFAPNYLGCYQDNVGGRTLQGVTLTQNNMSLEICAAFCSKGVGYQFYGTEYATQCYCGNAINPVSQLLTALTNPTNYSSCNFRCQGSGPEICGGYGVISLYNNTGYIPQQAKPSIGKYTTQGCLTDPGTNGRSLQGASMTSKTMTNEMCVKFCLGKQYHYAGIEYASECYCGNQIVAASGGVQQACNQQKLMPCSGNPYEYCGGPGFMTLYYSPTL